MSALAWTALALAGVAGLAGSAVVLRGFRSAPLPAPPPWTGPLFDVHGDGSVVVVPVGGHTHGSVAVFVTLPGGARYAFVGDLTWQLEGVTERQKRPVLMQRMAVGAE